MVPTPFHLAIPVADLAKARAFYCDVLGCTVGRSSDRWIDFNFWGHQLVTHLVESPAGGSTPTNPVDGHDVPAMHFGPVIPWEEFPPLAKRIESHSVAFIIKPTIRFENEPGEQATMFFRDPSGNAIEVKAFRDPDELFATA